MVQGEPFLPRINAQRLDSGQYLGSPRIALVLRDDGWIGSSSVAKGIEQIAVKRPNSCMVFMMSPQMNKFYRITSNKKKEQGQIEGF